MKRIQCPHCRKPKESYRHQLDDQHEGDGRFACIVCFECNFFFVYILDDWTTVYIDDEDKEGVNILKDWRKSEIKQQAL